MELHPRLLVAFAAGLIGCSSGDAATGAAGGDAAAETSGGGCDSDPLRTGLVAKQTGVSVDAFDCEILKWSAAYAEPDPMLFKAIIYVESRFDKTSVACTNDPCGTPSGWTKAETGCYGLMQIVPACGSTPHGDGLLPNGHPNLTTDTAASGWAGSIFNPDVNIEIGIAGIAGNRAQVVKSFAGCTVDQYTMMAVGNYNSYGSTKSCTVYNADYTKIVLDAYKQYATAAGYAAHAY
ncbi:MAG: transglycosylase SLT domain-containing protein [Polyangiales bacterium]